MAIERKKEHAGTPGDPPRKKADGKSSERKGAAKGESKTAKGAAKPKQHAKADTAGKTKTAAKAKAGAGARPAKAPAARRGPTEVERKKPARRREAAEPTRPQVRAQAKYVRSSARKARLVIDHIRGKSVEEARAILRHTPRGVARDIEKLLESAVANAENNHELVGDDLFIKEVHADEGPTLKRFRPRALGRATRIRKRTSHLTVTLSTKE